jgi:hypothetical protein
MEANGVDDIKGLMVILKRMPTILVFVMASLAKTRDTSRFVLVDTKLSKDINPPFDLKSFSKSDFNKPCPRYTAKDIP